MAPWKRHLSVRDAHTEGLSYPFLRGMNKSFPVINMFQKSNCLFSCRQVKKKNWKLYNYSKLKKTCNFIMGYISKVFIIVSGAMLCIRSGFSSQGTGLIYICNQTFLRWLSQLGLASKYPLHCFYSWLVWLISISCLQVSEYSTGHQILTDYLYIWGLERSLDWFNVLPVPFSFPCNTHHYLSQMTSHTSLSSVHIFCGY